MSTRRRIAVVTGSRAEYGLLRPLLTAIRADARLELALIATGMHLSTEFGLTFREIEADGFQIDERVHMLLASEDRVAMVKAVGIGTMGFADAYNRVAPDLVVVLGDRFEILAAAEAAMLLAIPIAHIHGGETSEGAIDEQMRHAITKIAHLHFTAAEAYRHRVVQLGEAPERVFCFGAPGLDVISQLAFASKEELETELELTLRAPVLLLTYHPATAEKRSQVDSLSTVLKAIDTFEGATVVATKPNADHAGREMAAAMESWALRRSNICLRTNLGHRKYLSVMRIADVVIGNSSSGLIEAPALRVPTVNIGSRQDGRLKALSVIDCVDAEPAIVAAVQRALSPSFRASLQGLVLAYPAPGNASQQICDTLANVSLDGILKKRFHDVEFSDV